jgi:hypothetical protein
MADDAGGHPQGVPLLPIRQTEESEPAADACQECGMSAADGPLAIYLCQGVKLRLCEACPCDWCVCVEEPDE